MEVYFQKWLYLSDGVVVSRFYSPDHFFASPATWWTQEEGVKYLNPCQSLGRASIRMCPPEAYIHYRKFSEISAALGISATIINLQNNYWGISPTPDPSKDTLHQILATK